DRGEDRPGDPQGARRRPLRRRGVRALARRRAARLRRRGDRDAAQADGGQPPPARRDRRRLPAADAPVPRVEPRPALAVLARDRVSRLLDRRARRDLPPLRRRRRLRARARRRGLAAHDPRRRRAARGIRQRALRAHALRAVAERAGAAARRRRRRLARARRAPRPDGRRRARGGARARRGACAGPAAVVQSPPVTEPVNVWDYEARAAEVLDPGAYGYYAGGAGDEVTLRRNVAAFGEWLLRPRVLVDVETCDTRTTVLGQEVAMPLLVAPVAYQRVLHPDGELAMARAAASAGTVMCLSSFATATPEEVAATGAPRWFQLYAFRDLGLRRELVDRARAAGYGALVLTVDTPVLGRRERDLRSGFAIPEGIVVASLGGTGFTPHETSLLLSASVSWRDVETLAADAGIPVVLKGVLAAEDARLACEHGAAGLVVSNHGGRQLDGVSATIDALPEVLDAVEGRIEVLLDGGIRRGADVVKALALGARAVLAGRAPVWGLAVGGEAGARHVLELLRDEIELALRLVGCVSATDVPRDRVANRPPRA